MGTDNTTLLNAALNKMRWHEARQKVISKNIANADTPGYRPQEIAPLKFKELLESSTSISSGGLATTNAKHFTLGGGTAGSSIAAPKEQKNVYETSPSGNSVIIEEQLLKMNNNYTDHRLTTTIYQKNLDLLRSAIKAR